MEYIPVVCKTCTLRIYAPVEAAGKRVICPDCGVKVLVPTSVPKAPVVAAMQPLEIGDYDVGEVAESVEILPTYSMASVEHYQADVGPLPRWTFFSRVFQFPWYSTTIARWGYMSAGWTVLLMIVGGIYFMAFGAGGSGIGLIAGISMAFFGMTLIWITIWSGGYSASCFLATIQDTAAGNDRVMNWPEPNWRDWFWNFLYVLYILALALTSGYAVGKILAFAEWPALPGQLIAPFLTFPILLLSTLENNSPFVPVSGPIYASLFKIWWAWILFYLLSGLIVAPLVLLVLTLGLTHPFLMAFLSGAPTSAAILIYGRLLGRLAWRSTLQ